MTENEASIYFITGLAGSGKTSFLAKAHQLLTDAGKRVYIVNLDPAAQITYVPVNLDIRDYIDFEKLCVDNNTGPNGGILLALNLFAATIDQFVNIVQKRLKTHDYILIDTPGQMELLLWSASGNVMVDNLKKICKKMHILYMLDKSQCRKDNKGYLSSNVLLFSTIQNQMQAGELVVFNKCDKDLDEYKDENEEENLHNGLEYENGLHNEILETFGEQFSKSPRFYISAVTGEGVNEIFNYNH